MDGGHAHLEVIDNEAFKTDQDLICEIMDMPRPGENDPLGIV